MKALFLDLDGTLLNDDKQITAGNADAIARMLEKGHKVIIATGRATGSALRQAKALGLTVPGCYLATYNGGEIVDAGTGEKFFAKTIPMEWTGEVFAEAKRRGIHIQTYDDNGVVLEPWCEDEGIEYYSRTTLTPYRVIDDISMLPAEPVKILALDMNGRELTEPFRQWVLANYDGLLDSFFSNPYYLEIVCAGLNKGTALMRLCEFLGICVKDTVAVGDAENDLPMIKTANTGVAVANAEKDVLAAADYVTAADNNHDAIAEVIDKFILN